MCAFPGWNQDFENAIPIFDTWIKGKPTSSLEYCYASNGIPGPGGGGGGDGGTGGGEGGGGCGVAGGGGGAGGGLDHGGLAVGGEDRGLADLQKVPSGANISSESADFCQS